MRWGRTEAVPKLLVGEDRASGHVGVAFLDGLCFSGRQWLVIVRSGGKGKQDRVGTRLAPPQELLALQQFALG